MSRIIVTGGSGRLGRSVVIALADAGNAVISIDRSPVDGLPAEQESVDLTDLDAARAAFTRHEPDVIVHLAAIAVPFSAPEGHILRTNTTLAFNVMQAGIDSGAKKIVVASSPTVIGYGRPSGWVPQSLPLDEKSPAEPWNAYGLSKYIAEQVMEMFARQTGDAVRFAAFRPCFVIAPEEWAGAPTQQGHTVAERLADPALSAPALFNYVDARDASRFIVTLINSMGDIPNAETFFVSADDALATKPLSELFPLYVPGSEEASAVLTGSAPAFSNRKARDLIGWQPQHSWTTEISPSNLAGTNA